MSMNDFYRSRAQKAEARARQYGADDETAKRRAALARGAGGGRLDPLVTQPPAVRPFPFDVKRERLKMRTPTDLGSVRLSIGPGVAIVMTLIIAWGLVLGIGFGANLAWRIERMGYIVEDTE
jgi:hypothetical protein